MLVWVEKEAGGDVIVIAESYRPSCVCIGRVASVLTELLCIGLVCRSYDSGRFCHINTVLLIHM